MATQTGDIELKASLEVAQVLAASIESETPVINTSLSNATYKGAKGDRGEDGPQGPKGEAGIYIGDSEPTDPEINVWIDLAEDTFDYKEYVDERMGTLTNLEIEKLLGGN